MVAAAARPELVVVADPCLEVDADALRGTVELELGPGIEYRGDAAASSTDTELLLDCGGEGEVELTIIDPLSETHATRIVALPEPARRAEQLGWAAAAFIRATWTVLELDAGGEARRDPRTRRAVRAARRPPSPWQIGDGFVVRGLLDRASPRVMLGEQVEVLHRPTRHFAWKADGELNAISAPVTFDGTSDRVWTLAIHAAPALLAWGEFRSARPKGRGTVALYGGAGLRVGGVRMTSSEWGRSRFELFAGPFATARASVSLGRFVRLAVQGEAGWILHGPREPSGVPLSFVGPWINGVLILVSSF